MTPEREASLLLAAHRAEFLAECTLRERMRPEEAAACLDDFEREALAEASDDD